MMFKKIVLGILAFAVLYSIFVVITAIRTKGRQDAFVAELNDLAAKADALKLETKDATLTEACTKLPRVEMKQLIAIIPKAADGLVSDERALKDFGHARIFGRATDSYSAGLENAQLPLESWPVEKWIFEFFSDFPIYWDLYFSWAYRPLKHDLSDVNYVVVHKLRSLDMPRVSSTTYEPGHMTFDSAVLDAKTGKVLCEGNTSSDQTGTVQVSGSGRTQADAQQNLEERKEENVVSMFLIDVDFFALRPVCWLGGESLCTITQGQFIAP
ncbi:MAG: hypothetical protein QM817_27140 [Archangium sp.]